VERPRGGVHYPWALGEFQAWFGTDAACLDYLHWLRWPQGFVCPECDQPGGWWLSDGRIMCAGCSHRTSVTAGTVFDRTRTPLTVWFTACWLFVTAKDGVSALSLQRSLEIGSYQTAWAMLHRLRSVLVTPGGDRLAGVVEVDETFIGGEEPGLPTSAVILFPVAVPCFPQTTLIFGAKNRVYKVNDPVQNRPEVDRYSLL
jgi:hypothetical protein